MASAHLIVYFSLFSLQKIQKLFWSLFIDQHQDMPTRDHELASHFSLQKNLKTFLVIFLWSNTKKICRHGHELAFHSCQQLSVCSHSFKCKRQFYRSNEISVSRSNLKVAGSATIFIIMSLLTYVQNFPLRMLQKFYNIKIDDWC